MFTFRVTEENSGSGEWWRYGEDAHHFFALHPREPRYLVQSRSDAAQCTGFFRARPGNMVFSKQVATP